MRGFPVQGSPPVEGLGSLYRIEVKEAYSTVLLSQVEMRTAWGLELGLVIQNVKGVD